MSIPSLRCLATALGISDLIAGKTTAAVPTMLWHAGEARKLTHLRASGLCLEPTQIASARPLYMLQLPWGPAGWGEKPNLMPLVAVYVPTVQSPSMPSAALPPWSDDVWLSVRACDSGGM